MLVDFHFCLYVGPMQGKKGRNNVTVDDLIHVITPKGRGRRFYLPIISLLLQRLAIALHIRFIM
jgi:hypothetical protein